MKKKWKNENKMKKMKKNETLQASSNEYVHQCVHPCASWGHLLVALTCPKGSQWTLVGWLATLAEFLWVLSLARMGQVYALRWPLLPRSRLQQWRSNSRGSRQRSNSRGEPRMMLERISNVWCQARSRLQNLWKMKQARHSAYLSSWVIRKRNSNSAARF